MNKPYVKQYDSIGNLLNPITKEQPYLHQFDSTLSKRRLLKTPKNNKKGIRLIVTYIAKGIFTKYKVVCQKFSEANKKGKKEINHYIPINK